jgi:hypothetical protein
MRVAVSGGDLKSAKATPNAAVEITHLDGTHSERNWVWSTGRSA